MPMTTASAFHRVSLSRGRGNTSLERVLSLKLHGLRDDKCRSSNLRGRRGADRARERGDH